MEHSKLIIGNNYVSNTLSGMARKKITHIIQYIETDVNKNMQEFPGFTYIYLNKRDDIILQKDKIKETLCNMKPIYRVMIYADNDAKTHIFLCELLLVVFDMSLKDILGLITTFDDTRYYGASKHIFTHDEINQLKKMEIDIKGVSSIEEVVKKESNRQNKFNYKNTTRKRDYDFIVNNLNKSGKIINNDLLCDMLNSGIDNDDILYAFLHDM